MTYKIILETNEEPKISFFKDEQELGNNQEQVQNENNQTPSDFNLDILLFDLSNEEVRFQSAKLPDFILTTANKFEYSSQETEELAVFFENLGIAGKVLMTSDQGLAVDFKGLSASNIVIKVVCFGQIIEVVDGFTQIFTAEEFANGAEISLVFENK